MFQPVPNVLWIRPILPVFGSLGKGIAAPPLLPYFSKDTSSYHGRKLSLDGLFTTAADERRNVLNHDFFLPFKETDDGALAAIFLH